MSSSLKNYILGFGALLAAVLVRWLLDPLMGDALPLVTLFGAVAAAVWLGGYTLRFQSHCSVTALVITCSSRREEK